MDRAMQMGLTHDYRIGEETLRVSYGGLESMDGNRIEAWESEWSREILDSSLVYLNSAPRNCGIERARHPWSANRTLCRNNTAA